MREPFNFYQISYTDFFSLLNNHLNGIEIPINIFDAVKLIYGLSMVDIAVLLDVSFGVVYRSKTKGIPTKRITQFSEVLGISPELLISTTTQDFDKLLQAKDAFFSRPNIEQHLNSMPEWKQKLANVISSVYLHCPIHLAQDFARVDRIFWTKEMPLDGLTECERKMIAYVTRSSKNNKPAILLEYSLDIAGSPHMRTTISQKKA